MAEQQDAIPAAYAAGEDAAKVGFDWATALDALLKVPEETDELRDAILEDDGIEDELGDLLFAVVNVARKLNIDPQVALNQATHKFQRRFDAVVEQLALEGLSPEQTNLAHMESIWQQVKSRG